MSPIFSNDTIFMRKKNTTNEEPITAQAPTDDKPAKKATTTRKNTLRKPRSTKKVQEVKETPETPKAPEAPKTQETLEVQETPKIQDAPKTPETPVALTIPALPDITIHNIIELAQAPQRAIVLTDQQIQQLSLDDIQRRYRFLEDTLARVLNYDVVISDTNIWLELLVGHTSNHSDPRVNARLQFERQLEFISKLMKHRGGKFMIMGETYEEIDRFAALQDPTNHKEADFTDSIVCLNAAARLAKRLILAQQRENRLRIEGISAESHHASFADPAIVRRVVELFATGKRVLLITNDASVAIRSIGLCDDLQRINAINDDDWDTIYAPLRPMVFTFDDLRILDYYTRQFYYLQMAAGKPWMADITPLPRIQAPQPLTLWQEAFRPGDKHRGDNLFITEQEKPTTPPAPQPKQPKQSKQTRQGSSAKQSTPAKPAQQAKPTPPTKPVADTKEAPAKETPAKETPAKETKKTTRRRSSMIKKS